MVKLRVGDSVGMIYKRAKGGVESWALMEGKITRVSQTKRDGWKYYSKRFSPLDAEDVDSNTEIMEESIGRGYILTREVFGLNEKTRPHAEQWIAWANENIDKAVSIFELPGCGDS